MFLSTCGVTERFLWHNRSITKAISRVMWFFEWATLSCTALGIPVSILVHIWDVIMHHMRDINKTFINNKTMQKLSSSNPLSVLEALPDRERVGTGELELENWRARTKLNNFEHNSCKSIFKTSLTWKNGNTAHSLVTAQLPLAQMVISIKFKTLATISIHHTSE